MLIENVQGVEIYWLNVRFPIAFLLYHACSMGANLIGWKEKEIGAKLEVIYSLNYERFIMGCGTRSLGARNLTCPTKMTKIIQIKVYCYTNDHSNDDGVGFLYG